jgi:predicted HTH domain antitoxin
MKEGSSMAIDASPPVQTWAVEQLLQLYRHRPELVQAALDRLLDEDAELRWALVLGAYLDRRINLGKAAELLGMHELELRERFLELGVPLRLGPADLPEARAEVEAARSWFREPSEETTSEAAP